MPAKHHAYDRRTGREVDDSEAFDRNGTLRDGFSLRVPLTMADSMTPLQRAVAADSAARGTDKILRRATRPAEITTDARSYVVDSFGNTDFHRPGSRFLQTGPRTVDHAQLTTLRAMADDAYRLHDAEKSRRWQGADGTDREIAVKPLTGDARQDAYLARDEYDTNAWRGPPDSGKW